MELSKSSLKVSENLGENLLSIETGADQREIPTFYEVFWEEQQKYIKCYSRGIQYHPMIIQFYLSLAAKMCHLEIVCQILEIIGTQVKYEMMGCIEWDHIEYGTIFQICSMKTKNADYIFCQNCHTDT